MSNLPTVNLSRYRGDTASLSLSLTDPDTGSAFNPTGCVLIFTLKGNAQTDSDAAALVQKISNVGGITVANPCIVTLVPADHVALPTRECMDFDVQAQNTTTGAVRTVARGTLYLLDDVTKELSISISTVVVNPSSEYLNAEQLLAAKDQAIASAAAAATSETNAAGSATTATTQAGIATTQAGIASTQASSATASATTATTQAGIATTQASTASTAATTATTQAGIATTQAGNAATSATTASTGATTATTQAGIATAQATSAAASAALASSVVLANVAPHLSGRAARGGIISTGASAAGSTPDNSGLAFAVADFSIGLWVRLPDWTPSTNKQLVEKYQGNTGFATNVLPTGTIRFEIGNGTSFTGYISTVATGIADGAWAFLAFVADRDGSMTFYVNGAQLGAPVSIAAQSANTITNLGPLLWLANQTFTFTAGTLGETFIINGLLTATQIADIYKAGSIAPLASSFTFYQWLDFSQGYGPIIRDRSGQNQHALMGTSGLSHAIPRNPPGIPQRAPRTALNFDGSSNQLVRSTLNSQNPGTGDFTLWLDYTPTAVDTLFRAPVALSSGATNVLQARALIAFLTSSSGYQVSLYGATTADYRQKGNAALAAMLLNKRHVLAITRSASGVRLMLGIDGDFFDATNLFSEVTAGTPPAWTDQVDGIYHTVGFQSSSVVFAGQVFDTRLANVAMTEAQLRAEYERGEPGSEWTWGNVTPTINSNFSAGADGWTAPATGTVTGNTDGIGGQNDTLLVDAAAGGIILAAAKAATLPMGKRYRLAYDVYRPSANTGGVKIRVANNSGTVFGFSDRTPAADTWVTYIEEVALAVPAVDLRFYLITSGGAAASANDKFYLKNVILTPIGYTARLRTDRGCTKQALDDSSNGNDFLLSSTGVVYTPSQRAGNLRALNVNVGTAAYLLLAQDILDTGFDVSEVRITNNSGGTANTVGLQLSDGTNHTDLFSAANILAGETVVYRPAVAGLDARRRLRATAASGAGDLTFSITVTKRN